MTTPDQDAQACATCDAEREMLAENAALKATLSQVEAVLDGAATDLLRALAGEEVEAS